MIGSVQAHPALEISSAGEKVLDIPIDDLLAAWKGDGA